jgi:hypothetical protein
MVVKCRPIYRGRLGYILNRYLIKALALHEIMQSPLQQLPRAAHAGIPYITIRNRHKSLIGRKKRKSTKQHLLFRNNRLLLFMHHLLINFK